jgi:Ca2+-binding EF-hand superfamily protein
MPNRGAGAGTQALIGKMLDAADTNGDGEIDKDEFVAWYGHARAKLEKAVETLFRVFPGVL